jgi:hypothetical protein
MPSQPTTVRCKTLLYFLLANYLLSLIIASPYLGFGPTVADPWPWVYARAAFLSTFAIFMILLGLILWPFTRLIKSPVQLFILPPTVLFLFQVLLLADVHIYEIFRFHINGLVINTLTTEGVGDSVQVGGQTVATLFIYLGLLCFLEWGGLWGLARYFSRRPTRVARSAFQRKSPTLALILLSVTIVADKGIFAYANFYDMTSITRYQKLFPLYLPLFADETLEKYLGWEKPDTLVEYRTKSSLLNYPLKEFRIEEQLKPVNIVWVAVESWRFDMMSPEVTPHIQDFSTRALVFEDHYSGGNASRFGIFSLFYGVYGTYWHQFLAERRSPLLIDILQHLGYEFKIMSSTQLSYPELRKTAFVNLPPQTIEDRLPGNGGPERDPEMARRFDSFLQNRDPQKPFFSFMFLDSPHAPYRYPKEFAKFQPTVDEINYFEVKKAHAHVDEGHPLFNRYRNAIFFSDSVVDQILSSLEKRGLLNSTVVVITGDHGEEFYETGYYGHTSAFSDYQVKVPLILYIPGQKPGKVTRLTSHLDLVPTMLSLMGSRMDPALYSHGHSLLSDVSEPYVVASGWDTFAVIDPGATLVLSSETYNARTAEVRSGSYRLVEESKPVLAARRQEILEVTKGLSRFLR